MGCAGAVAAVALHVMWLKTGGREGRNGVRKSNFLYKRHITLSSSGMALAGPELEKAPLVHATHYYYYY